MDEKQLFIDSEYCIDKYFDDHVKSRLDFYMQARQAAYISSRSTGFGVTNAFMPSEEHATDVHLSFEANDINKVSAELFRDPHDIDLLAGVWKGIVQNKIGESRYNEISAALGGDLAQTYVRHRLTMRMVDYEAEKNPFHGSADYVLDEMSRHSEFMKKFKAPPSDVELQQLINRRKVENYDPSLLEQRAGKILGMATDVTVALPLGGATSWAGVASTAGIEVMLKEALPEDSPATPPNVSMIVSCAIFGHPHDELRDLRRQASSVNPYSSEVVNYVNDNLSKKIMRRRDTTNLLLNPAPPMGIKTDLNFAPLPDYSSQLNEQVNAHFAIDAKFGPAGAPTEQEVVPGTPAEGQPVPGQQQKREVGGWGGMLDQLGLSGFSTVGKNLGYVIAMLPDLLIGMFTGKSRNLKIDDNLLPIGSIVAGLFVKNPLLKMLLIGFGGANLLNKAGHEALDIRDGGQRQPMRLYREYSDEVLDGRIKQPEVRGNTLIATIDNVPSVITINDEVADAYERGLIPLNTLSNAILRKFDEQKVALEESYDREAVQDDVVERSRGLK